MQYELDTSGLLCPYPLLEAKKFLKKLKEGDTLRVISTDPASEIDFKVFSEISNDVSLESHCNDQKHHYYVYLLRKLSFSTGDGLPTS
jgi:tRNA 2-thiouridine synthesizing protein A